MFRMSIGGEAKHKFNLIEKTSLSLGAHRQKVYKLTLISCHLIDFATSVTFCSQVDYLYSTNSAKSDPSLSTTENNHLYAYYS